MTDEHASDADVRLCQVVIDRTDPRSLASFWMRFTGFEATPPTTGSRSAPPTAERASGSSGCQSRRR